MDTTIHTGNARQKILVVDNNPVICTMLGVLLEDEFEVVIVTNGLDAIQIAKSQPPDLILLDIVMPDPNGYEVCRKLKEDKSTADIPIIFLSAKDGEDDETTGLSLGAADYIRKPFSPPVVRARIRTQLDIKKQRDSLIDATRKITRSIDIGTKNGQQSWPGNEPRAQKEALVHCSRLAAIGEMATCMAHEIGNPLNAMGIILQKWSVRLKNENFNSEGLKNDIVELQGNVERISRLTSHIRTLGRARQNMNDIDVCSVVNEALSLCCMQHHNNGIELVTNFENHLPKVRVVAAEIEQVVVNLLSNAYYSTGKIIGKNGAKPKIKITVNAAEGRVKILVEDNGGGVEEDQAQYVFEPFFTTKPPPNGTGLGLCISKEIMEKFHGGLILHNRPGISATFEAWLPAAPVHKIIQAS